MNFSNVGQVRSGISKVLGVGAAGGVGPTFNIGAVFDVPSFGTLLLG